MKKVTTFHLKHCVVGGIVVLIMGAFVFTSDKFSLPRAVVMHPSYAADFSDDKILIGASHNVFIGRVIKQVGEKQRGVGPESQFEVEIVENIKGDLRGNVIVNQQGGYKDDVLYIVGDAILASSESANSYLLHSGSTYLFATRYNEKENWHTLNSYPTAKKNISSNATLGSKQLKAIAASDLRVLELKAAYPNEILLDTDVKNNKVFNNYQSMKIQSEEKSTASEAIVPAIPEIERSE